VGRELQQNTGQSPQQVFLVPLLIGTDGHHKMSKSLNNHIGVAEPPREIYGKVMSISDSLILDYFELVTDVPEEEITEFKKQLKTHSVNPMNLKKRLAYEIVNQFHNTEVAREAEEYFKERFQTRELHKIEVTDSINIKDNMVLILTRNMPKWLVDNKFANSMGEAKRLLAQGAVRIIREDGTSQVVRDETVRLTPGDKIKVGKRHLSEIRRG
jgi:tyrosyl-tRNA synthetase